MKGKSRAAMFLAAVLLTGAAAPGTPVWALEQETAMKQQEAGTVDLSQVASPGTYIRQMTTDRSMYSPGETIRAELVFSEAGRGAGSGTLVLVLRHLGRPLWQQEMAIAPASPGVSFQVPAPEKDFTGYSLEARLYLDGTLADYRMTGVDVSSDWNVFPRYGYVTRMDRPAGEVAQALDRLKNHHINGLFYYDVFDTQEKPLAGTVDNPADTWYTLNRSLARRQTLLDTIETGHYRENGGRRGTVIAAYMNYDAPKSENFNRPSINYVNAVLMSAGASHLELGDTGMLSSEYYPGNSMQITSGLAEDIRRGSDFKPGNVTSFTRIRRQAGEPDREILHLLNFNGAAHDSWVDKGLAQTEPETMEQVTVSHYCTWTPSRIWMASPDYQEGICQEIPFTQQNGTVTFTLPYLKYYTMVVME